MGVHVSRDFGEQDDDTIASTIADLRYDETETEVAPVVFASDADMWTNPANELEQVSLTHR